MSHYAPAGQNVHGRHSIRRFVGNSRLGALCAFGNPTHVSHRPRVACFHATLFARGASRGFRRCDRTRLARREDEDRMKGKMRRSTRESFVQINAMVVPWPPPAVVCCQTLRVVSGCRRSPVLAASYPLGPHTGQIALADEIRAANSVSKVLHETPENGRTSRGRR